MIPLLMALPFGPMLAWKRGDLLGAAQRLGVAMAAALIAVAARLCGERAAAACWRRSALGLGVWLICGSLADLAERLRLFDVSAAASLSRLRRPAALGARDRARACRASASRVIGIVSATRLADGRDRGGAARRDGRRRAATRCSSRESRAATGPNYREERAQFLVSRGGGVAVPAHPDEALLSRRARWPTTEAAIETAGFSQLYVSLGDQAGRRRAVAVRASYKPLVTLIWLGRAGHGVRRRAVALRPAASASARRAARGAAAGGGAGVIRLALILCPRLRLDGARGAARRAARRPGAGGAGARHLRRAALPRLPEPVDRRFRRAAGARPAPARARAAEGRRQRRGRCATISSPATASSSC